MILTDADLRREEELARAEEKLALEWLLLKETAHELRAQLQAAVELLGERMGEDPNRALAERVARNRAAGGDGQRG